MGTFEDPRAKSAYARLLEPNVILQYDWTLQMTTCNVIGTFGARCMARYAQILQVVRCDWLESAGSGKLCSSRVCANAGHIGRLHGMYDSGLL